MADELSVAILMGQLQSQHPGIFNLLNQPGVFDVAAKIIQAEAKGQPLTDAQIKALFQATPYYQQTPANQRDFILLSATDPATTAQAGQEASRLVNDLKGQLGVQLTPEQQWWMGIAAAANGWDATRIRYEMLLTSEYGGQTADSLKAGYAGGVYGGGDLAKTAADVKALADSYGVPLSDNGTIGWAQHLLSGQTDMAAVQGYMIEQAKSLFPGLAVALDQGITVSQYAAPYTQLAQQELGVNPSDIVWTDPKWMKLLNQVDPNTGTRVSMSLDQALQTFRTDPTFGYDTTNKARSDATQLATQLSQKFGAM